MNNPKVLSKKNPYYLPEARMLELKYFCRQYPIWQAEYYNCIIVPGAVPEKEPVKHSLDASDVEKISEKREALKIKMDMVVDCSKRTDDTFGKYIFRGVTTGLSYDELWKRTTLPISRSSYYELLRKFYWLLDSMRG